MSSMVLVDNPGSHWRPPEAFGGPQTASNTSVSREPEPYGSRKRTVRVGVAPRGSALLMKRLPTTPGMCGRLRAAAGGRAGARRALQGGFPARPGTVSVRFVSVGLSMWNNWL